MKHADPYKWNVKQIQPYNLTGYIKKGETNMVPDIAAIKSLPDDAHFTPADAARLLGMSPDGVIKRMNAKQLGSVRVAGRWFTTGKYLKQQITVEEVEAKEPF